MSDYKKCPMCIDYAERRQDVLAPEFAKHADESGETSQQILDRYMGGIHKRHLAGLPLLKATS